MQIEILYCGICHSDLHYARNEWSSLMQTVYPCVPGHEIVGRVTKAGSAVTRFKAGDLAAVGCLVDSDLSCPHCRAGIIESLEVEPAPLRMVLGSQALEGTLATLRKRIADFQAQTQLAASTDFPSGE